MKMLERIRTVHFQNAGDQQVYCCKEEHVACATTAGFVLYRQQGKSSGTHLQQCRKIPKFAFISK